MLLHFNKKGQLIERKEQLVFAGSSAFDIFAYFDDLDIDFYAAASLKLVKPDLDNNSYVEVPMTIDTKVVDDKPITGYYFNFSDYDTNQDDDIILDTVGKWGAIITLFGTDHSSFVQGIANFYVGQGNESLDDHVLSDDIVMRTIMLALADKLNIKSSSYLHIVDEIPDDEFDSNVFSVDDVIFNKDDGAFYKLNSLTVSENNPEKLSIDINLSDTQLNALNSGITADIVNKNKKGELPYIRGTVNKISDLKSLNPIGLFKISSADDYIYFFIYSSHPSISYTITRFGYNKYQTYSGTDPDVTLNAIFNNYPLEDLATTYFYETTDKRVSEWQETPDDNHYPSEKLVKDELNKITPTIELLNKGQTPYYELNESYTMTIAQLAEHLGNKNTYFFKMHYGNLGYVASSIFTYTKESFGPYQPVKHTIIRMTEKFYEVYETTDGTVTINDIFGFTTGGSGGLATRYTYETKNNKVTSWQETPDDNHYPSEKLVKNYVDNLSGELDDFKGRLKFTNHVYSFSNSDTESISDIKTDLTNHSTHKAFIYRPVGGGAKEVKNITQDIINGVYDSYSYGTWQNNNGRLISTLNGTDIETWAYGNYFLKKVKTNGFIPEVLEWHLFVFNAGEMWFNDGDVVRCLESNVADRAVVGPTLLSNGKLVTLNKYVSGTNDGTNWTSLTVNGVTKNIPSGSGLYQHIIQFHSGSTNIFDFTVSIIKNNDTHLSTNDLMLWLENKGFTSTSKLYPASGVVNASPCSGVFRKSESGMVQAKYVAVAYLVGNTTSYVSLSDSQIINYAVLPL